MNADRMHSVVVKRWMHLVVNFVMYMRRGVGPNLERTKLLYEKSGVFGLTSSVWMPKHVLGWPFWVSCGLQNLLLTPF